MTIKKQDGPVDGLAVMQQALSERMSRTNLAATPLGGSPQTGSPVQFFHLSLNDLKSADPLALAASTGWRYPVIGGIHPGLVDVRDASANAPTSFGGLSRGILAERFLQASILADQLLGADPQSFEPRLLDAPAVQFTALWMHGETTDYFFSLLDGKPPGSAPLAMTTDVISDLKARALSRFGTSPVQSPPSGAQPFATPTN